MVGPRRRSGGISPEGGEGLRRKERHGHDQAVGVCQVGRGDHRLGRGDSERAGGGHVDGSGCVSCGPYFGLSSACILYLIVQIRHFNCSRSSYLNHCILVNWKNST